VQLIRVRHAVLFGAALAACNGVSTYDGAIGGGSAAAPPDVVGPEGPSARPPPEPFASVTDCPAAAPSEGASCDGDRICDYGNAAEVECNERASCTQNQWSRSPASGECQACPATYEARSPGAPCTTTAAHPFVCSYYEGTCGCVPDHPGAGADAGGDAGAPVLTGTWRCTKPADGCPARRPIAGNACVRTMSCDYGSCLFGMALSFLCQGTWSAEGKPTCP
jgi:hypothetical protein